MNFLDLLILVPSAYGGYVGFRKGLIIEVCTLLAFVLGVWGGIHFSDYASEGLIENFDISSKYLPIIAFAITFIVVAGLVYFVGKMIEKTINLAALKPVNKFAGLGFGMIKYLFIMAVVIILVEALDNRSQIIEEEMKSDSLLYQPVQEMALQSIPALEDSKYLLEYAVDAKEQMDFLLPQDSSVVSMLLNNQP